MAKDPLFKKKSFKNDKARTPGGGNMAAPLLPLDPPIQKGSAVVIFKLKLMVFYVIRKLDLFICSSLRFGWRYERSLYICKNVSYDKKIWTFYNFI